MLRVKDFTWHPGYMELNEAELDEPMRGEVKLRRVKRHYHERAYGYEMPVTPDALEVARRASTWLLVYMWRRALFAVQYEGRPVGDDALVSATREALAREPERLTIVETFGGVASLMPSGSLQCDALL